MGNAADLPGSAAARVTSSIYLPHDGRPEAARDALCSAQRGYERTCTQQVTLVWMGPAAPPHPWKSTAIPAAGAGCFRLAGARGRIPARTGHRFRCFFDLASGRSGVSVFVAVNRSEIAGVRGAGQEVTMGCAGQPAREFDPLRSTRPSRVCAGRRTVLLSRNPRRLHSPERAIDVRLGNGAIVAGQDAVDGRRRTRPDFIDPDWPARGDADIG